MCVLSLYEFSLSSIFHSAKTSLGFFTHCLVRILKKRKGEAGDVPNPSSALLSFTLLASAKWLHLPSV